jgi:hypothetical protein
MWFYQEVIKILNYSIAWVVFFFFNFFVEKTFISKLYELLVGRGRGELTSHVSDSWA